MRKTKSRRKIQVTLITLARGLTLCPRGRTIMSDTEQNRLQEAHENGQAWSRWGPYLSERQWGTVREDYSPAGRPGTSCRMTRRARTPTGGAKTACWASAATRGGAAAPAPHALVPQHLGLGL